MTGRKIDDLLGARHKRFTPLARLLSQSQERLLWTDTVRALLPPPLGREVSVLNYRASILTLQASNAGHGTRLRYHLPKLTDKLRNLADFQDLQQIRVRVSRDVRPPVEETLSRSLPGAATDALSDLAHALAAQPEYAELRTAVLRLGGRDEAENGPDGPEHTAAEP